MRWGFEYKCGELPRDRDDGECGDFLCGIAELDLILGDLPHEMSRMGFEAACGGKCGKVEIYRTERGCC